ncbi:Structural maintenance of chromosomes protein 5 [Malassezia vespertilionis]|uniref:Structural maintenance of chromosomes protein 5 n=1 Tax=Malassezia vespertilionis TaxID=2020962 RepID=A0A2N1JA41_9BASI|nr:Structural maintenance of chromosomes protein 5 [Malassezia vespertilionis]PKI83428.1 Smc5p [Malassezia vespertilionis]WFD07121.1 Structural maintenance of chromosomes protein 5 [Malassezia vespertilionis]
MSEARRRPKRRREDHDTMGEADTIQLAQDIALNVAGAMPHEQRRATTGYVPGSIVRVACERFVTYDAVEFFPGPYLNMIIGPNGTGKSTVVSAIALGLGWKPSVLGRAKDVASYVKLGHGEGWVEIELQGFSGKDNIVIRRVLFRESNSSDWLLNGANASAREVNEAVSQFHIEVGNLCTFLPQDRVADFAYMSPQRLLRETQYAAGHPKLSEWHDMLISFGGDLGKIKQRITNDTEEYTHLENRNRVLERDVRRYEERVELENRMRMLEARVHFAKYREAKQRYDIAHTERAQAKTQVRECERALLPVQEERDRLEQRAQKMDLQLSVQRKEADDTYGTCRRIEQEREQVDLEMSSLNEQERQLEAAETNRGQQIQALRARIAAMEEETAEEPAQIDTSALDADLRAVKGEHRTITEDCRDLDSQQSDLAAAQQQQRTRKQAVERKLTESNNIRHQRLQILAHNDKDTYEAIRWLDSHRDMFQHRVYDPVLVLLSVKRPDAARAVETCLNWNIQRTFVCQSRADYDLFTRELIDTRGWRLNVVEQEGSAPLTSFKPPISLDALQEAGFDNYILDNVDAPEDVLRFLCTNAHIHLIPISFRGTANAEEVERLRKFQRYIIGTTLFTTFYSKYGKRLPVTQSRELRPLRNFAHSSQSQEKGEAEHQLVAVNEEIARLDERVQQNRRMFDMKRTRLQDLSTKREQLVEEQRAAHRLVSEWRKARSLLAAERQKLVREESRPSAASQRQQINDERKKNALQLGKAAERYLRTLHTLMHARKQCDILVLSKLRHTTELNRIMEQIRTHQTELKEAMDALERVVSVFGQAKEETLAAKHFYELHMESVDAETQQTFFDQYRDDAEGVDQLELQLQGAKASFDIPWGIGPSVLEAFRARKAKIAELKATMDATKVEQTQLESKVQRVESQWLPSLEHLVANVNERFSAAFARLGCAGEVRLARDESFEKWGIDILVKFRETEQLQLLTGHRQSGGERSLSTILYLLSLTELARSPFSLVDEINQGMDPRAERAVHDQMVAITCRPEAGQYFLITPKLLTGLRYHELMKVLLINNGIWLPERLNLSEIVSQKRARVPGASDRSSATASAAS